MAVQCKFVERPRTFDEGVDILEKDLFPLLREYWDKEGRRIYNRELSFNASAFINLWVSNGLILIIAYEDKKAVGFMIGIRFQPMLYQTHALQVENIYGKTPEVKQAVLDYMTSLLPMLFVEEVWNMDDLKVPGFKPDWHRNFSCAVKE